MGISRVWLVGVSFVYLSSAVAAPVPKGRGNTVRPPDADTCGPYDPGGKLSYDDYMTRIKDLRDNAFSLTQLEALNTKLDEEMSRALLEVLTHVNDNDTRVIYGSYSHPGSRKKTFGGGADPLNGANQDEGEGLRVVFNRDVKAKDGSMRSIFVIFFTRAKKDGSGFELIEGGDAIRVRSELGAARQGENSMIYSMAGVSYDVRLKDGKVSSITAPSYQDETGARKKEYAGLQNASNPVQCNVCHSVASKTRLNSREFGETDVMQSGDAQRYVRKLNIDFGEKADKLTKLLETPKTTFVPAGLVELLKAKCK